VRLTFLAATGDERSSEAADEPPAVRPLRILIVDDDIVVLKALRDMLEGEGHCVVAFDDGRKAIQALASQAAVAAPFDVVITDLGMPHVDGRQVAAAVKSAAPATPVIMLTGWGRQMAEADVPRHVDRLLSKPPGIRELQSALASVAAPR
jgi:CheY-like chemotaxis protein